MGDMQFQASAAGNMILMGEYAVLDGSKAVLMTLRHRLHVSIKVTEVFEVISDKFGHWCEGEAELPHIALCRNVIKACGVDKKLHINITSDIPSTYGFGSSAALVAALIKALFRLQGKEENFTEMFTAGHRAILDTYGRGSGADLAAALSDQPFIVFDPIEKTAVPFDMPFAVQAIYTGYKTPTPEVLKQIHAEVGRVTWEGLTRQMKKCVDQFLKIPTLELIGEYQTYMDALGVTCDACRSAIDSFAAAGITAKISGSGRGDCIVGFSASPVTFTPTAPLEFLSSEDLCA